MVKNILAYILLIFVASGCANISTGKSNTQFQIRIAERNRDVDSYGWDFFLRKDGELVDVNGHTYTIDFLIKIFCTGEIIQKDGNRLDLYIQIDNVGLVTASDLLSALRLLEKCAKNSKKPWKKVTVFVGDMNGT